jgi:hypothetical protein
MMMRCVVELSAKDQFISVPGTDKVLPILSKYQTADGWICPDMRPRWGKFFSPSSAEVKESIDGSAVAKREGLASHKTAISHIAHDIGIDDVELEIEAIKADSASDIEHERGELVRLGLVSNS